MLEKPLCSKIVNFLKQKNVSFVLPKYSTLSCKNKAILHLHTLIFVIKLADALYHPRDQFLKLQKGTRKKA